jgi:hypothetical protein
VLRLSLLCAKGDYAGPLPDHAGRRISRADSGPAATTRAVSLRRRPAECRDQRCEASVGRHADCRNRPGAPELALAYAGVLSEPIRDRAAQSGLHLWDGPVDPG